MLPAILVLAPFQSARADEGSVILVQQADVANLSGYLRQVLEYNQRIQRQNNAPKEFPSFVRDKFDITIVADGYIQASNGMRLAVWRSVFCCFERVYLITRESERERDRVRHLQG